MQEIIVKQVDVKTGEKKDGTPWKMFTVVDEDGGRFSSFDTKLDGLPAGTKLEVETKVKGSYVNITSFKILSKPAGGAAPGPQPAPGGPGSDKAAAVGAVCKLYAATLGGADHPYKADIDDLMKKALIWLREQLGPAAAGAGKPRPEIKKGQLDPSVPPPTEPLKDVGELFTRCQNYGVTRTEAFAIIGVDTADQIIDLDEAWQAIFKEKFEGGTTA